jgi:hypothetical protein
MKDEGPYVLEWLAYHKVIGFDHFVVYANDCWDSTSDILCTAASELGIVSFYDNTRIPDFGSIVSEDPQRRAYLKALKLRKVMDAEFVLVIDADEFLNIHVGAGTLDDLINAVPPFEAMSLTWKLFGSSGLVELKDDLVIKQFTRSIANTETSIDRKLGVKTLFRPGRVEKIGVHRPFHCEQIKKGSMRVRWLNGSGEDHYDYYRALKWHASSETNGCALAEINHYAIKSAEAFLTKIRRGSANSHDTNRVSRLYWDYYNHNEEQNTSIQRHIPAVKAQIEKWYLQCPDLEDLHLASVEMHKKIAREMIGMLQGEDPKQLEDLGITI